MAELLTAIRGIGVAIALHSILEVAIMFTIIAFIEDKKKKNKKKHG